MSLYEAAFGYTELRLYVYVFMIWLGLFLVWFLIGLWRRPDRFALGALVVVMGFLATLNLMNPDAFIVRQNVARYWTDGKLDVLYLNTLSADAVPALVGAISAAEDTEGKVSSSLCIAATSDGHQGTCKIDQARARTLQRGLQERFQEMQRDPEWRRWQSFQLSRWCAYRLLSRMFA
jgi:hypothetical protein